MFDFFDEKTPQYDEYGFDENGIHKDTNSKYDIEGFDSNLIHKDTGKPYNKYGFNKFSIHYLTGENRDNHGFYISKIHSKTNTFYDERGFDIDGINLLTGDMYDDMGFDINGKEKLQNNTKKETIKSSSKNLIKIEDLQNEPKEIKELQKLGKIRFYPKTKIIKIEVNTQKQTSNFDENGIHHITKTAYDEFGFDWNGFHKDTKTKYDNRIFNIKGIHKITRTKYDEYGWSREKKHQNGSSVDDDGFDFDGYDEYGFDRELIHKITNDYYDEHGFDYLGLHKLTNNYYDKLGFNRDNLHINTKKRYDKNGYDKDGLHKDTKSIYDKDGYDKSGVDRFGWDRNNINKTTKTKYDKDGYDRDGYDKYNWNRNRIHKLTKIQYKKFKFKNDWSVEKVEDKFIHHLTGSQYNTNGFDIFGWSEDDIYIQTHSKYDKDGYDRFGYDEFGFDKNRIHKDTLKATDLQGFFASGYNKYGFKRDKTHKNGTYYDEAGFDIYGKHKDTNSLYNKLGFDKFGYYKNKSLYDKYGFDAQGLHRITKTRFNKYGFNQSKTHQITKTKYDKYGFDIDCIHKDTKTKYDKNSFNIDGIHKDTKKSLDKNRMNRDGKKQIFSLPKKPNTKTIIEGANYYIPQKDDKIYDISQHNYTLGKLLGKGGEGSVYKIADDNICKIYNNDKNTNLKRQKIARILELNPEIKNVCFPKTATYNKNGEFIGYISNRAYGYELSKVLFVPKKLKSKFPNWNRLHLTKISIMIIKIVKELHDLNIIVGDLNPNNILIETPNKINWIDTDSFQIEEYPCPVGMLEYTRTIHHNENFGKFLRTKDDDVFALIILLFQIQFSGLHPYAHIGGGSPKENMKKGIFPYPISDAQSYSKVPKGNWRNIWDNALPKDIKRLYYDTFSKNKIYSIDDILAIYEKFIIEQKSANVSSEL
jgi:hypothetical protein